MNQEKEAKVGENNHLKRRALLTLGGFSALMVSASKLFGAVPNLFSSGTPADANQFNENFDHLDNLIPIGSILGWMGGYYTNNSNGGFTNILGNSVTEANAYLNPRGWWVCDGGTPNQPDSPIFNTSSNHLPNLTDDRFLMGSTTASNAGGSNTMQDHTHSFSLTAAGQSFGGSRGFGGSTTGDGSHGHSWATFNGGNNNALAGQGTDRGGGSFGVGGGVHSHGISGSVDISHTHGPSSVSGSVGSGPAANSSENRPNYLSCFYIMRVV